MTIFIYFDYIFIYNVTFFEGALNVNSYSIVLNIHVINMCWKSSLCPSWTYCGKHLRNHCLNWCSLSLGSDPDLSLIVTLNDPSVCCKSKTKNSWSGQVLTLRLRIKFCLHIHRREGHEIPQGRWRRSLLQQVVSLLAQPPALLIGRQTDWLIGCPDYWRTDWRSRRLIGSLPSRCLNVSCVWRYRWMWPCCLDV